MSNYHPYESEDGAVQNGSAALSRREARAKNTTGELPLPGLPEIGHPAETSDFGQMLQSLRDLFEHDRQIASQSDSTRCGICYLHFHVNELHYREEGFYVCSSCENGLRNQRLPMLRKQQKL